MTWKEKDKQENSAIARTFQMCLYGLDRLWVKVGRLPNDLRKGHGVVGDVDPKAGGNFQNAGAGLLHVLGQNLANGFLVALGGRRSLHFGVE